MQTLNLRLTRDNLSRPWGFRLQGGSDTGYPLSVQRVFSGSPAEGILQRNDEIKLLDNCNVENASLKEVQDLIRTSGNQLNFIVARDSNKSTNYDNIENEEKISVQSARRKFLNSENRSPFGQFGTEYQKKSNTLPTSLTIETNNEFAYKDNVMQKSYEMNDDDVADYNFMTLPVSERKKLFATPGENMQSRTMPRQRTFSFRPTPKSQTLPRPQSSIYQRKPPEFGWGPSAEKLERARNTLPVQSTLPLRYENTLAASPRISRTHVEKVSNTYYPVSQSSTRFNQGTRRFNSTTTIPGQIRRVQAPTTANYPSDGFEDHYRVGGDRVKSQARYVYHCGRSASDASAEPSIMIIPQNRQPQQTLYVNTYAGANQAISPAHSPRYFRPAYPAYSVDHNAADNMSIISVRSEPYSKRMDRSIGYDKAGAYRINRDSSSAQRDSVPLKTATPFDMNRLHIGEPRTRIVANPASPSYHLNWSFWGPNQQNAKPYEQPVQSFNVESHPTVVNSRSFRIRPAVPKSQSTLILNPSSAMNDSIHSEASWMKKHRDSSAGVSDF